MQCRVAAAALCISFLVVPCLLSQTIPKAEADGDALFEQGQAFERTGHLRLAIAKYEAALHAYEMFGDLRRVARALAHLGGMEAYAGKPRGAEDHLARALVLIEKLDDKRLEAEALIFLGWVQFAKSNFSEAKASFARAREIAETLGDTFLTCQSLIGLGWVDRLAEEGAHAADIFREAIRRSREAGCRAMEAEAWYGLAAALQNRNPEEGLMAAKKAEELARKAGNKFYLARALHGLGNAYGWIEHYERAIRCYEEGLLLKREIGDEGTSGTLIALGLAHKYLGQIPAALVAYKEAESVALRTGNRDHLCRLYNNMGSIYLLQEDYRRAAEEYGRAAKIAEEIGSKGLMVLTRANRARALAELPDAASREEGIREIVRLADEMGFPHVMWVAHAARARHAELRGEFEEAEQSYEQSLRVIEGARTQLPTLTGRARYLERQLTVYEQYIEMLYGRLQTDPKGPWAARAFEIAERAKARSLLDALPEAHARLDERLPENLRERKKSLLTTFSRLQAELVQLGANEPERKRILAALEKTEAEWDDFLIALRKAAPTEGRFAFPEPRSLEDIQKRLAQGDRLVSYLLGDNYSFVWAVSSAGVRMHRLPRRSLIETEVSRFREALAAPTRRAGDLTDMSPLAGRLYQMLLGPLSGEIARAKRLCISPDGVLHYLPFEALQHEGTYLVERHEVSYVPSASVLLTLLEAPAKEASDGGGNLLAVGAPVFEFDKRLGQETEREAVRSFYLERGFNLASLPFAREELRTIAHFFPADRAEIRLGSEAQEAWLKRASLERFRYIHFATHAFADEQMPQRSALVLSMRAGQREDGLLQAREIVNLKLGAELVVLSGCRTGLGRILRGEGILGLTQSFLYAGTPSVVVSLWDVRDRATAVFMEAFYKQLRRGRSKSEALRLAKLSMLRSDTPAYHHPYYWAPFVLVGKSE